MGRRQNHSARPTDVRPVDVDGVRTVAIVTVGWGIAFVVLALRQGQLNDAGRGWWLWTCLAGVGLGLLGLEYCRRRRDAIAQAALEAEADAGEFDDSAIGDWSRLPPEQEFDVAADELPQPGEQESPAEPDHVTQPYQPAEQPPRYTTGDMPVVPGHTGSASGGQPGQGDHAHGQHAAPHSPPAPPSPAEPRPSEPTPSQRYPEPAPQRPAERPRPRPAPPAPQQPSVPTGGLPSRPAAQRPTPPQRPVEPPARQAPPAREPEPPPPDPYSTGAGWYDSAAGYSPDADRARAHPRDRRPDTSRPSGSSAESPPAAGSPPAGGERRTRRPLEDSEFFGDDSSTPPPNSTAEFLLADLEDDDESPPPPASHDRDAPGDEYGNRRARRSR